MRFSLAFLLLAVPAFATVPTAAAHHNVTCDVLDLACMRACLQGSLEGHGCSVTNLAPGASTETHTVVCHVTDVGCMARCLSGFVLGHECGIYSMDPEVAECPAPSVGTVVTLDGRTFRACFLPPGVAVEPCPWPSQGYVVRVDDGELNTCFQ